MKRNDVKVHAVTKPPRHHFFGYYDKQQWDATDRYMLGLSSEFHGRQPEAHESVGVGIIDTQNENQWRGIAETLAWCWQQGSMLQWIPDHKDEIIFNTIEENTPCACVMNPFTGHSRLLPRPVYCLSHDGRSALSLNFSRLDRLRPGYGYSSYNDAWGDDTAPAEDGIHWMDIETGKNRLILSHEEIASLEHDERMDGVSHWVNPILFSPDDKRVVFYHRWTRRDQPSWWHTRVFTMSPAGEDLYLLANEDVASHLDWRSSNELMLWSLYRGEYNNFVYKDLSRQVEVFAPDVFTHDGHSSFSPDGRWLLSDNVGRDSTSLVLLRLADLERYDIGSFTKYVDEETPAVRCDLHPRWNRAGTKACFDSVHEGTRQMYVAEVRAIINEGNLR